jgi:hypothetical protein
VLNLNVEVEDNEDDDGNHVVLVPNAPPGNLAPDAAPDNHDTLHCNPECVVEAALAVFRLLCYVCKVMVHGCCVGYESLEDVPNVIFFCCPQCIN